MAARTNRIRRASRALLDWFLCGSTAIAPVCVGPPPLTVCPTCREPCVHPVEWEERGDTRWWMVLRCGACEAWRELVVGNDEATAYDEALGRQTTEIEQAIARLDRERMTEQLETFVAALDRDLIDASSFA